VQARNLLFFAFLLFTPVHAAEVFLPEDELTLPPYLYDIVTTGQPEERLNVTGLDQKKHQAKKGEWLDYGDALDLPGRIAFQVIQRETIQWVGGGVFQGRIGTSVHVQDDLVYELNVKRGWIKVWARPDKNNSQIRILTDAGNFRMKEGSFWLNTRPGRTEIYMLQGELMVEATKIPLVNKSFSVFEKGKDKPTYQSREWDPDAMEVKIASAYPQFVKLSTLAQEEWDAGKVTRTYAVARKKGWRKASRLDPHTN
jgi:hypothetical protein